MDRLDSRKSASPRLLATAQLVEGTADREIQGLAEWLAGRGLATTRVRPARPVSDRTGIRADPGHAPASTPRWLVHAPDVPREHPERLAATRDGIEQFAYCELLRDLIADRSGILIAGRRQGAVAAAMIGWALEQSGLDPTILLRGALPQLGCSGRAGEGRHAVVDVTGVLDIALAEAPGPDVAVVLDVDHLGPIAGESLDLMASAVASYLLVPPGHPALQTDTASRRVESVSLERGSTWWGADLREDRGRFRFRAFHRGRFAAEIRLQVPGRSTVLSALAAVAVCLHAEVPIRSIIQSIEDFAGISRGFQSRGSYRGVTLVDDDAVEASDVAETIVLARSLFGRRQLWVVFAPAGPAVASTAQALSAVDRVILLDSSVDSDGWSGMLERAGVVARHVEDLNAAIEDLDRNLEPGDVLLTLGAGDVGTIADAFIRRLPRHPQSR